ncbi:MAG: GTP-binding protein [Syntrophobacteraceae bacterium]
MKVKVPIVLVTGEAGSGKTTLVRRALGTTDRCAAVLMSESEDVPVEGGLARSLDHRFEDLSGDYVCGATPSEIETAVQTMLEKKRPELLFLEATGASQTHVLVQLVEDSIPQLRLDTVICVVDAFVCAQQPRLGRAVRARYEAADVMLLNKIDLLTTEELKSVEARVRRINGSAVLFKTVGCDIDLGLFFGVETSRMPLRISPHGETGFQAFTYRTRAILDRTRFLRLAAALPPSVFRAKGIVRFAGETCLFNYVAGRLELESAGGESTEVAIIGRDVHEDRDSIVRQLRECEVSYAL